VREVAKGAAKAVAMHRGGLPELFQNETTRFELKQPMPQPMCYAYVKWPCADGMKLAL
jgi:hypothetical protein